MAPRAPESKEWFLKRLRSSQKQLATAHVGFGSPHFSHAVVEQDGVFRVRRLVLDQAKAEAYMKEHRMFMPEHAEMLSEPTGAVVLEAKTLDELISKLEAGPWPL